jgi:aminoglycoside phosphotransferase (APT) family kinase protein
MALSNTRDPLEAERALTAWLDAKVPEATDVEVGEVEIPASSGLSHETILFRARWREPGGERGERMVARVCPSGPSVFPTHDLALECRVMNALGEHTAVPVPPVLFEEVDPSHLGGEFVVMRRVDGRVPSDDPPFTARGWVLELSPDDQRHLYDNGLKVLADIHAADVATLDIDGLRDRPTSIDGHLAYWEGVFEWAAGGESNPTVEAGFEWIRDNIPSEEGPLCLSWGDARIGNMIFADDLSVAGVLDWEMAAVGSPEIDLAWWLFILRHHTEGIGAPPPPGFPSFEETVARYEELSGREARNVHLYEVFSALRLAVLMHRAGALMIGAGLLPPDAPMKLSNPASVLLAKLADLPPPRGAVQSFIGNR